MLLVACWKLIINKCLINNCSTTLTIPAHHYEHDDEALVSHGAFQKDTGHIRGRGDNELCGLSRMNDLDTTKGQVFINIYFKYNTITVLIFA